MKSFWRQFEGWATGLKNDPFTLARIRITILCAISVAATLLLWEFISSQNSFLIACVVVLLVVIIINFLISNHTLDPIRKIITAQKRFIANASHELRTPLAIMKTVSEIALLNGDNITPQEANETIRSNIEEIDRMSKIIESLLSLSYYHSSADKINFEKIDLATLVTEVMGKIKVLAKKKSINLKILNMDHSVIMGSPVAIQEVVINLVKNSIAYTPPRGTVSISVTSRTSIIKKLNVVELEVKDTGIGIDENDLHNVFNPFFKANRVRNPSEPESSGLGLTIVKNIVERHNGSIAIKSALGKGTTITIAFPALLEEN